MPDVASQLNLTTLPFDILTNIIRMEEKSMDSMRLISHYWNTSVLLYLNDGRFKPELERVCIDQANDSDFDSDDDDDDDRPKSDDYFVMYTIVPERSAGPRIGMDKWLVEYDTFTGAIEVASDPQLIVNEEKSEREQDKAHVKCSILRMTRFFSAFSHIKTLQLEGSPSVNTFENVLKTMGGIHIEKLLVYCNDCCDLDQNAIVELVRNHRIQYVFINTNYIRKKTLRDFAIKIAIMNATMEIRRRGFVSSNSFLHKGRSYWEKLMAQLSDNGVSMHISNGGLFISSKIKKEGITKLNVQAIRGYCRI